MGEWGRPARIWRISLALRPTDHETFYREVDEELRRDQMRSWWERFGKLVIAGIVLFLALIGGFIWWQNQKEVKAGERSEKLIAAFDDISGRKTAAANAKLDELAASGSEAHRAAALLTKADLAIEAKDLKRAALVYKQVADDDGAAQARSEVAEGAFEQGRLARAGRRQDADRQQPRGPEALAVAARLLVVLQEDALVLLVRRGAAELPVVLTDLLLALGDVHLLPVHVRLRLEERLVRRVDEQVRLFHKFVRRVLREPHVRPLGVCKPFQDRDGAPPAPERVVPREEQPVSLPTAPALRATAPQPSAQAAAPLVSPPPPTSTRSIPTSGRALTKSLCPMPFQGATTIRKVDDDQADCVVSLHA